MSVIYATLERLETDNPPLTGHDNPAGSPQPTSRSQSVAVKTLVMALLIVTTGASVMLWHSMDGVGKPGESVALTTANQRLSPRNSEGPISPEQIAEPAPAAVVPTGTISASPAAQTAVYLPPASTVMATATNGQGGVETVASLEPAAREEPVALADAGAEAGAEEVSSPLSEAAVGMAEPVELPPPPSTDAPYATGVEEVIEQARLALSRGLYPQALAMLEQLEPVPENRADFWLIKGSAHLGIGQLDPAETAFGSAQALAPDNAHIAVQRAILYQERGDHASALQILKGMAIRHPNVPEIYLNQGYSEYALGAVRDAERSFRTFLKLTESRSLYVQQRQVVTEWLAQVSSLQS